MVNFTFKGHKISIRNDDWRKLKERFVPKKANWSFYHERYQIIIGCSLCERYKEETIMASLCGNSCPLKQFRTDRKNFGCMVFLELILGKLKFTTAENAIYWYKRNNPEARRQLKAILRRMEKIEKDNQ